MAAIMSRSQCDKTLIRPPVNSDALQQPLPIAELTPIHSAVIYDIYEYVDTSASLHVREILIYNKWACGLGVPFTNTDEF